MAAVTDATRAIAERLASLEPYPAGRFGDRGIVVCAGGAQMFVNAYVLLRVLRETLRCSLPIELWHMDARELSPVMRSLLADLDVEFVDAEAIRATHPAAIADGWQLKPYAILHSRFREVLLLDADQVPIRDPVEVFEWPQYRDTGALFWPDIVDLTLQNPVWSLCGLAPRRSVSLESGQLAIDKERQWTALNLTLHLNEQAETFYRLIYGDKDTFLLGWLLADAPHAIVPHRALTEHGCIVQRDFAGGPLFQHRTNAKWTYAEPQMKVRNFVHEQACLAFLSDLRAAWNGRMFYPPERSLAARRAETLLVERRTRLIQFGEPDVEIEFLRGHQIGVGRGPQRHNWFVGDSEDGLQLVLRDTESDTYRLALRADGAWAGHRLIAPFVEALIAPPESAPQTPEDDDGLIADLVTASGLATRWTQDAEAELLAALRLIDRASPGVADRLRAYCSGRAARNPRLRQCLADVAALLPGPAAAGPSHRSPGEVLGQYYTEAWRQR